MGGDFFEKDILFCFKNYIMETILVNTIILQYKKKIFLYKIIYVETCINSLSSANKYKVQQSNISVLFGADILF